jgi:diguanylate cyclase (GGDEF)-like protein
MHQPDLSYLPTYKSRRTLHLIGAMAVAITLSLLAGFSSWSAATNVLLLLSLAGLACAAWAVQRGRVERGATLSLWILALVMTAICWLNRGAYDETVLVYPCLLALAATLSGPRLFCSLLGFMLLSVGSNIVANIHGWYSNPPPAASYLQLFIITIIFVFSGYVMWLLAADMQRLVAHLRVEITNAQRAQAKVEYLLKHDVVTELPNRVSVKERFGAAVAETQTSQAHTALMFIDLDHFKTINDSLNHDIGDAVLRAVAARLQQAVGSTGLVGRQGGDEFLIVQSPVLSPAEIVATAQRIIESMQQPLRINGMEMTVPCSLGVAISPDDGSEFDSVLQKAELAMYHAKRAGRNMFRRYDAAMSAGVKEQLTLINNMRLALTRNEFVLQYQPQFDLRSGELVGAEALIRWSHPELGMIPPATFIPLAEKSGLIVEIGEWVLLEACRQTAVWHAAGLDHLSIAINLSPVQFHVNDVERSVMQALQASNLPASCIELEITESLLLAESGQVAATLQKLRALGIGFAIDDFGTGYSNLSYVKNYDVSYLKIDRSFVRHICRDASDRAIVHAIIKMAHGIGIKTIAEGVEDAETLALLIQLGCDRGQGFYWAPALFPHKFGELAQRLAGPVTPPSAALDAV